MSKNAVLEPIDVLIFNSNEENTMPSKEAEDACEDIYVRLEEDQNFIIIRPHTTVTLPTGIHSVIPEDYAITLLERSSTGTKGIGQRSGVIDSGYRGEWSVPVTNHSRRYLVIARDIVEDSEIEKAINEDINSYKHMAISAILAKEVLEHEGYTRYPASKALCQMALVKVLPRNIKEISKEDLVRYPSKRGEGRLGSSGK